MRTIPVILAAEMKFIVEKNDKTTKLQNCIEYLVTVVTSVVEFQAIDFWQKMNRCKEKCNVRNMSF